MAEWLRQIATSVAVSVLAGAFSLVMWVWCILLRSDTRQLDRLDRYIAAGHQVLAVFWHGKYLPLFALAQGKQVVVITVNSFRGRIIAAISRRFGYRPVLLPTNANSHGFPALVQQVEAHAKLLALALDGPSGPYQHIRTGALHLSAGHGVKLVPIGVASEWKIVLGSRWDRQEIPLPFSRVALAVGEMIDLAAIPGAREPKEAEAAVRQGMDQTELEAAEILSAMTRR